MKQELRTVYDAYDIVEKYLKKKGAQLDVRTKQFVVRYAMITGELSQVEGMLDEFLQDSADSYGITEKYEAKLKKRLPVIRSMENLLIAAEMYRIEESKAMVRVQKILADNGISMTMEQLRVADADAIKQMLLQKKAGTEKTETIVSEPEKKREQNVFRLPVPYEEPEEMTEETPQEENEDFLENATVEETKVR